MKVTIKSPNPHPAAFMAAEYLEKIEWDLLMVFHGLLAPAAAAGDPIGKRLHDSLCALLEEKPLEEQDVFGLAWFLREQESQLG